MWLTPSSWNYTANRKSQDNVMKHVTTMVIGDNKILIVKRNKANKK